MSEPAWVPTGDGGYTGINQGEPGYDHALDLTAAVRDLLPRVERDTSDMARLVVAITRLYMREFRTVDDPTTPLVDESSSPWWKFWRR